MTITFDGFADGLGATSAFAAVAGAVFGIIRSVPSIWNHTFGRRRNQRHLLNRLLIGSSPEFISSVLGVPQFRKGSGDSRTDYHRLDGVWVLVEYVGGSVGLFAITITSRRHWISTSSLTRESLNVVLGKTLMQQVGAQHTREDSWIGANRFGHLREYYFGRPGGYQTYWLAYNSAGCGDLRVTSGASKRVAKSTVNTLIVAGPAAAEMRVIERQMAGVDPDTVRLASSNR